MSIKPPLAAAAASVRRPRLASPNPKSLHSHYALVAACASGASIIFGSVVAMMPESAMLV
jgi:hypothetical protein